MLITKQGVAGTFNATGIAAELEAMRNIAPELEKHINNLYCELGISDKPNL